MRRLGIGDARLLWAMLNGQEVASSKLSTYMTRLLKQEGILLMKSNGSHCKYRIAEVMREPCRVLLAQQFGLLCSLEEWIDTTNKNETRSELVARVGNSKYKKVRTFRGFLVNCYTPIETTLNHRPFLLTPQAGTSVFVNTPAAFEIPGDVVVVGIENAENFMQIRKQKLLFETLTDECEVCNNRYTKKEVEDVSPLKNRYLFVSRYPQENLSDLRAWLMRIPNRYVHFGDFDLAGVHIYLSEFYAHLGLRASFLVPPDIEERLANGNADLYDQQYARFKNMEVKDSRIRSLVDMIHHYRKGYEQEGYIQ